MDDDPNQPLLARNEHIVYGNDQSPIHSLILDDDKNSRLFCFTKNLQKPQQANCVFL